jgi:hypothetical protein
MCAACVEYGKEKLTLAEFKSALKEASRDNPDHQQRVEGMIKEYADKPEELRRAVKPLATPVKDY